MEHVVEACVIDRQSDVELHPFLPYIQSIVQITLEINHEVASFVDILFVSDSTMRRYHKKFFRDPSSTDCMSFPLDEKDEPLRHLGGIIVCTKTALRIAKKLNCHPFQELTLYIVHGVLHLLGYSDISNDEKALMRIKEQEAIRKIEKTLHFSWLKV
jgi:probable rRNA maturation factor